MTCSIIYSNFSELTFSCSGSKDGVILRVYVLASLFYLKGRKLQRCAYSMLCVTIYLTCACFEFQGHLTARLYNACSFISSSLHSSFLPSIRSLCKVNKGEHTRRGRASMNLLSHSSEKTPCTCTRPCSIIQSKGKIIILLSRKRLTWSYKSDGVESLASSLEMKYFPDSNEDLASSIFDGVIGIQNGSRYHNDRSKK